MDLNVVKNNGLGNHTFGSKYSLCHATYVPCEDYMNKVLGEKKYLAHSMGSRKEFNSPMLSSQGAEHDFVLVPREYSVLSY